MQMRDLKKFKINIKKSQTLLFGSLLVFIGVISLSFNYLLKIKDQIYSDMRIAMMNEGENVNEISGAPISENVSGVGDNADNYIVDYSKYLGVLEIPRIGLKRGFYGVGSKYNNIQYNVSMVNGTSLPNQVNGNTILMAHSGDAYISYFANLYKLDIGDIAHITYGGNLYTYQLVNRYDVAKVGVVNIKRNHDKTCLTLITCTKDNDSLQTIYIFEQV